MCVHVYSHIYTYIWYKYLYNSMFLYDILDILVILYLPPPPSLCYPSIPPPIGTHLFTILFLPSNICYFPSRTPSL